MAAKWFEAITGSFEQKKQYRHSMARIDALPDPYRSVARALHRYVLACGGVVDGDTVVRMVDGLADLWEQAAADHTPRCGRSSATTRRSSPTPSSRRTPGEHWADKQRRRLADAIDDAIAGGGSAGGTMIHVSGLTKAFKNVSVLRGVDLDVATGEIVALLGSNGAGKTTLIRILATVCRPDAGTAVINGHDVATAPPQQVRESISLTGQFAAVDEALTGRENLVLVAQLRHPPRPARRSRPTALPLRADRGPRPPGRHLLRRHAPPPRHRHEPGRPTTGDFPR